MTPRIPFCDLDPGLREAEPELGEALQRVLGSRRFVLGPEVERFEALAGAFLGVEHAVGVSSGTDALVMALSACGVREGDAVMTTPLSFVATVEAVLRLGATPRFADVDPATLCLDVSAARCALGGGVKAILPVHLFGREAGGVRGTDQAPAGGKGRFRELAESHGAVLVEDAAQAFGSRARGRALGTSGNAGCFSFFPTKVLGALGDAGLVVTDDANVASHLRSLRQHGIATGGRFAHLGGNYRMDAIQAAALSVLLPRLPSALDRRRRGAARYDAAFDGVEGLEPLGGARSGGALPVDGELEWNAALYTVRVQDGRRDALRAHLAEVGIETRVYYERPLHLEPACARLGYRPGDFPVAERAAREVLSLPLYPGITDEAVERVVGAVSGFFA